MDIFFIRSGLFQYIACAAYCMDQFWGKAVIDFFPEIPDINIHHIGTAFIIVVPDMLFYFFTGQDNPLVAD
jgi:hypothetical protein